MIYRVFRKTSLGKAAYYDSSCELYISIAVVFVIWGTKDCFFTLFDILVWLFMVSRLSFSLFLLLCLRSLSRVTSDLR
jgi:hypothetical protein